MLIALIQDLLARHPFLIIICNFDDSHSAQLREQLPFLVNRFRINLNKNGVVGMPFVLPCDGSMLFYGKSMFSLSKKHPFPIGKHEFAYRKACFCYRKAYFPLGKACITYWESILFL